MSGTSTRAWGAALTVGIVAISSLAVSGSVRSQDTSDPGGLALVDQTFSVAPRSLARFEFVVTADVPEIAAPTTSTTTTTTSTTTTTTTTTLPGATAPPPDGSIVTGVTSPATTTVVPAPLEDQAEMIVQVRAHRPTTARADVDASLDGALPPVIDLVEFDLRDVSTFDPVTGERRLSLAVPIAVRANLRALDLPDPGVYPISVQIRRDGQLVATTTTFIERTRTDGIALRPLSLAPLAGVAETATVPTDAQLDTARQQLTAIAELAETTSVPLTLRIPAQLIDTVLTTDPGLAERLRAAVGGDALLATTDLPLDPSSATAAGIEDEFVRRLREGEADTVTTFGASTQRSAWLLDVPATAEGAATLGDLGVQLLVLPFQSYRRLEGSLGELADTALLLSTMLPDQTPMAVAVVDPAMRILDPDYDGDPTPVTKAVHLMAEIATVQSQLEPDRRSLVVATPDLGVPDAGVMRYLEQFAGEHPDMHFEPLAALPGITNRLFVDGEEVTVDLADEPPVDLSDRARAVNAQRFRIADVTTMLPPGDPMPSRWDTALRTALTTGMSEPAAAVLIDGVELDIDRLRASVEPPEAFPFTIGGRQAQIPLRLTNTSSTPLTVQVHLESDKLAFPVNDLPVELPPNATTEIQIDVTTRSNGVAPISVEIRTPAGSRLTEPVVFTARVNNLTGLGRVLTVGFILVLATWWFTYFKRRRREIHEQLVSESVGRHPTSTAEPAGQ